MAQAGRPNPLFRNLTAKIATLPMIVTALVVFVGCSIWTVVYSFTPSRALPITKFVGLDQYERLFSNARWEQSVQNLLFYGVIALVFSFVIGFVLAALMGMVGAAGYFVFANDGFPARPALAVLLAGAVLGSRLGATASARAGARGARRRARGRAAAARKPSQKTGSRLIEVSCPAMVTDRLMGPCMA